MSWNIDFYDTKTMKNITKWPIGIKAKFTWIVELIKKHGPQEIRMPHVRTMGNGLFEIRAKGKEGIGRSIFCVLSGKRITILTGFIKKTEKTPNMEIELSIKRMKEVIKNE
jgi:phage-related protein